MRTTRPVAARRRLRLAGALILAVLASSPGTTLRAQRGLDPALERNKDIVQRFFAAEAKGDVDTVRSVVSANYIEHASYAPDGRDALLKTIADNRRAGTDGPTIERSEIIRMIAEGDEVWVFTRVNRGPDLYARINMYRLEGDVIAEHWAVNERLATERPNPNDHWAVGKGAQDASKQPQRVARGTTAAERATNKTAARNFFLYVEAQDMNERRKLLDIATEYIQHNPGSRTNGIDVFVQRANPLPHHMLVRMIAEGDYVWCLNVPGFAGGQQSGSERVNFNQWRIESGKLAEHWGTYETMASQRANGNDVLGYGRTATRDFTR